VLLFAVPFSVGKSLLSRAWEIITFRFATDPGQEQRENRSVWSPAPRCGVYWWSNCWSWKRRSSTKCSASRMRPSTYEEQAAQPSENLRNSLGLNYKSAVSWDLEIRVEPSFVVANSVATEILNLVGRTWRILDK